MGNPCQDESVLSAYLDGELSAPQSQEVRRHIADCRRCRRELNRLEQTDRMIKEMDGVEPSPGFDRAFWDQVEAWETRRAGHWWHRWALPAWRPALAAGLCAGLALAVFVSTRPDRGVTAEDRFIAENIEMLDNYDLIHNLEILENWDAINAVKEFS